MMKAVFIALGIAGLLIVLVYLSVALGWILKPAEILDADRVETQVTEFYDRHNALQGIRSQVESLDRRIQNISLKNVQYDDMSKWSTQDRLDYGNLSETKEGLITAHNRQCSEYNADWQNWYTNFGAKAQGIQYRLPTKCEMY